MPLSRKQPAIPITASDIPAIAGPIILAPLKIIEFSEIALGRSSRPTISTTNACRPGMSNELTKPLSAASAITYSTFDDAGPRESREHEGADHQERLRADYQATTIDVIDHHAGEQRDQHDWHEARKRHDPEHQRRVRELQHQPRLRDHLHPGADQRDQLSDEEEPEIAMPQRAEGGQPAAPAILCRDVSAGLVGFGGFYLGDRVDDLLSMN